MRLSSRLVSGLSAVAGLLLVGCAAQQAAPTVTVAVRITPTAPEAQVAAASDNTLQLVIQTVPTPFAEPDTGCLECHTNTALLQELGEEEVVEKISEGTG